jgi:hypothetical protein
MGYGPGLTARILIATSLSFGADPLLWHLMHEPQPQAASPATISPMPTWAHLAVV